MGERDFFKPDQRIKTQGFYYEDENGVRRHIVGVINPHTAQGEPSLYYTDPKGERKKVENARRWWYEDDEKE